MKRYELNFRHLASVLHISKLAIMIGILLALDMSVPFNADAQRHGGSGRGSIGRSSVRGSFSRVGTRSSRIGGVRTLSANFGGRGYIGRGFYYNRGIPYWRYSYYPFWGDYFWGIPPYALRFYLDGYNYYDSDGIYYKYDDNKYQVVPAPIGYKVKTIPKGSLQFTLDGVTFYYYFGSYYTPVNGQFEVVQPPIGAEVDSIPEGFDKVVIDGQTYYTLNGVQYKAVIRDNVIWYQVVKNNGNNPAPSSSTTNQQPMQNN
jgi:hypothetical protein